MNASTAIRVRRAIFRCKPEWLSALLRRVARRLFYRAQGTVAIDDFDRNLTVSLDLREHMQSRIFWLGYYNQPIVEVLDGLLAHGMVVVDVGANIGEISMVAAKRVGPAGLVLAFEPLHRIAAVLEGNLRANALTWAHVVRCATSDHAGTARIYLTPEEPGPRGKQSNMGLGTLFPQGADAEAGEEIELARIDDLQQVRNLQRLDLMKIDIEGAELSCLRGAAQTIARFRPRIIVEIQRETCERAGYSQHEILRFMLERNYACYRIGSRAELRPVTTTADLQDFQNVLCVPQERMATSASS